MIPETFLMLALAAAQSGGIFGALVGGAIGAMYPGEKWEKVSPSLAVHSRGGFAIAFTVEF